VAGGAWGGRQPQGELCAETSGHGHTKVVKFLLEHGADPTITNNGGLTPLMAASGRGHLDAVRCLLDHTTAAATINYRNSCGETALWVACHRGRGAVAELLLERGADPTIADVMRMTPMAKAQQEPSGCESIIGAGISVQGRKQCVAALKVRGSLGVSEGG
jgi:ankyrin repeat protein